MDLKSTYNQIAKDWGDEHVDDTWWCEGVDKFVSFLPKGGTVLDVGCGVGQKSEYLVKKGLKVTAFDFSDEMVKLAKSKVPRSKIFVKRYFKTIEF